MLDLEKNRTKIILIGATLIVSGFLLSLLMAIRIIKPNFILLFASCSLSIAGSVIGFYVLYTSSLTRRTKRLRRNRDHE